LYTVFQGSIRLPMKVKISVVIPIYKNEDHLNLLNQKLSIELTKIYPNFEIIYICDGSPDKSWLKIKKLASLDKRIKGIDLSKNYGQQAAIMAGLSASIGEWVVVMDGDLQDNPEDIEILYKVAVEENKDLVIRRRLDRKDTKFTKLTSVIYYFIYNLLVDKIKYDGATGNFGVYSRKAVNSILQFKEDDPSFAYFVKMIGYPSKYIDIEQSQRSSGSSSYTFSKRLKLALNYFISHSIKPIKLMIIFGLIISIISFGIGMSLVYKYYKYGVSIEGWTSIAVLLFFQTGLIASFLGIIGLYIGKIFLQTKNRPQHLIQETINFNVE